MFKKVDGSNYGRNERKENIDLKYTRDETLEDELLNDMVVAMHEPDRHQPSVSGMIRCITRTYWENELKLDDKPKLSRREIQLFASGLGLEKVLLSGRQNSIKGEFEGIQYHIDHLGTDGFIEFKSTRIKLNDDIETGPKVSDTWLRQVLSYFKAVGITQGHFVMFHVMGNYNPPFPDLRAYAIEATQEEIDDNWTWIQQRAVSYLTAVKNQQPPTPFTFNESWECKECPWYGLCLARKTNE